MPQKDGYTASPTEARCTERAPTPEAPGWGWGYFPAAAETDEGAPFKPQGTSESPYVGGVGKRTSVHSNIYFQAQSRPIPMGMGAEYVLLTAPSVSGDCDKDLKDHLAKLQGEWLLAAPVSAPKPPSHDSFPGRPCQRVLHNSLPIRKGKQGPCRRPFYTQQPHLVLKILRNVLHAGLENIRNEACVYRVSLSKSPRGIRASGRGGLDGGLTCDHRSFSWLGF